MPWICGQTFWKELEESRDIRQPEDGIPRYFARGRLGLSEKPGKRMNLLEIQKMYVQYSVLL